MEYIHKRNESLVIQTVESRTIPFQFDRTDPLKFIDHAYGFCYGLGGWLIAEAALNGTTHPLFEKARVAHVRAIASAGRTVSGVNTGIAGEFMCGWGLYKMGCLKADHALVLKDRIEIFDSLTDSANEIESLDFAVGLAGNLVGLARACEIIPRTKGKANQIKKRIESRIFDVFWQKLKDGDPFKHGLAHGLAGVVFGVLESGRVLGMHRDANYLKEGLTCLLAGLPRPYKREPFCWSAESAIGVLSWAENHNHDWLLPLSEPANKSTSGCCGEVAFHFARLKPLPKTHEPHSAHGELGYYSLSGFSCIVAARSGVFVPDPLWGRWLLG